MNPYSYLCSELTDKPILMRPDAAERLVRTMTFMARGSNPEKLDADTMQLVQMRGEAGHGEAESGTICGCAAIDGVAIIPVHGPLLQRRDWLWEWFGMTSFELVTEQVARLSQDSRVRTMLLDVDSGGGMVAGCFDAARKIRAVSQASGKKIIGAANEQAFSAAYALISACDEIYAPETAGTGSIGVWTLHSDYTRALDKEGIELTIVRAGERKARGGWFERADRETMAKKQASVEETWTMFAKLISDHRGNRGVSEKAVFDMEGDWFGADESLSRGLIDGIGSFDAIFNRARSLAN